MGRRSLISMTTINRLISASNRKAREREREQLIKNNSGDQKEMAPELSLQSLDFNMDTRITKLEFLQTQNYRTITKYVTQNYVRYPIYSEWKTRKKIIKKTIKLTNEELEKLNSNSDYEIKKFASEIILKLNNPDLLPSWFLRQLNLEAYKEKIEALNNDYNIFLENCKTKLTNNSSNIKELEAELKNATDELSLQKIKSIKFENKINKLDSANKHPLKYIFTLFIYGYTVSKKRRNKLVDKLNNTNKRIENLNTLINENENKTNNLKNENQEINASIQNRKAELEKIRQKEYNNLSKLQNQVTPLPTSIQVDLNFIPLSTINGMTYSKIIGCYIIHNINNDKYYVGQSKDVIKRLKQHFKGTVPNNIIFAEDYYLAPLETREKLFEIKIIPCTTKDELDRAEKQLIEEYNAFEAGYNGTSGNN